MVNNIGRRYLKTRGRPFIKQLAAKISTYSVTPNQISLLSVVSALIAALVLFLYHEPNKWLLAVLFIQFRLFCNMLDGLVAIEGGKKSKLGDVYNDLPDRVSDILIIVAFGYSLNTDSLNLFINNLAWLAAILAVFTAYVRNLFISLGTPADYSGPMAKPQRMALISAACLACYIWSSFVANIILFTLICLDIGLLITIYSRVKTGVQYLWNS